MVELKNNAEVVIIIIVLALAAYGAASLGFDIANWIK